MMEDYEVVLAVTSYFITTVPAHTEDDAIEKAMDTYAGHREFHYSIDTANVDVATVRKIPRA